MNQENCRLSKCRSQTRSLSSRSTRRASYLKKGKPIKNFRC
jgi:hypothetical protein